MQNSNFLKVSGITGIGTILPLEKANAVLKSMNRSALSSVLIPAETTTAYPWDLGAAATLYRQDITEGKPGVPLNITISLINVNDNCNPVANARVNLSHCDKDGYYAGKDNQDGYLGITNNGNETFQQGMQISDAAGQVKFSTIYPGWYPGRATHIHARIFLNAVLSVATQFEFPDDINELVYTTSAHYMPHGVNTSVTSNAADCIFSEKENTIYEMLTVVANNNGGYDATITVGIDVPTSGLIKLTPETGGQFTLNRNFPNPFMHTTSIGFSLAQQAKVWLDIYDVSGAKVAELLNEEMEAGEYTVMLNKEAEGRTLSSGNYAYQLNVACNDTVYRQVKMMTIN